MISRAFEPYELIYFDIGVLFLFDQYMVTLIF